MPNTMIVVPIMTPAPSNTSPAPSPAVAKVASSMEAVTIEPKTPERPVRSTSVKLSVPLDAEDKAASSKSAHGSRKLMRRDSLDRREAFLKGKEGSRQRRRWENDRLLSNPWATPPLPSDWEVRPTYPTRTVPYYLAPLWDAAEFQRAIETKLKGGRKNSMRGHKSRNAEGASAGLAYGAGMSPMEEAASNIPKDIRAKLKHARAAKGLLQDLEEVVRDFVRKWNEREARLLEDGLHDVPIMSDSEEDDEIVFIGRNGVMHDSPGRADREKEEWGDDGLISKEKLVFEGLEGDKGAGFARWLVHCVGSYYGLRTWSVTKDGEGEQKRREAYVGVDGRARGWMGRGVEFGKDIELPRPLWGMV